MAPAVLQVRQETETTLGQELLEFHNSLGKEQSWHPSEPLPALTWIYIPAPQNLQL